jgi:hypothetical protein
MRMALIASAALAAAGCSGSGNPPNTFTETDLAPLEPFLTAPLSAGQSTTFHYRETTCRVVADPQPGRPGNISRTGCGAPVIPSTLIVKIELKADGTPCAATATLTAPGTVVVMKTGPGDPARQGYCNLSVRDPNPNVTNPPGYGV